MGWEPTNSNDKRYKMLSEGNFWEYYFIVMLKKKENLKNGRRKKGTGKE